MCFKFRAGHCDKGDYCVGAELGAKAKFFLLPYAYVRLGAVRISCTIVMLLPSVYRKTCVWWMAILPARGL